MSRIALGGARLMQTCVGRQMSMENLFWGAPRIHGELLRLQFESAVHTNPAPIA
jgi:hypothetical protein